MPELKLKREGLGWLIAAGSGARLFCGLTMKQKGTAKMWVYTLAPPPVFLLHRASTLSKAV